MKRIVLLNIVLFLLLYISCMFNLEGNIDDDNTLVDDTITGWESAGIVSVGDSGHHVDVCHYQEQMFTFNYRGELYACTYPDFSWSQMNIPDGNKIYAFYCDTINGMLYVVTRQKSCNVYEYDISKEDWRSLTPRNNPWFDSTKLLDGELSTNMYDVTIHNNKVFMMTAQGWSQGPGRNNKYVPKIWCSARDTVWEKADSSWYDDGFGHSDQVTAFFSIDEYLYATAFERGLWRYDGVSWMVMPGTTQEEVKELSLNGGDTKTIPGFRPRSLVKHNNDIYVGNLSGYIHKLLTGNSWDRIGRYYREYVPPPDTVDHAGPAMSLFSYNGHLIRGTRHFNEPDDLWYNMTPHFNKIDTMYNKGLPGTVYGMINIGDTLFAAIGNNEGKHSGVYFLDLKTRLWYQEYH